MREEAVSKMITLRERWTGELAVFRDNPPISRKLGKPNIEPAARKVKVIEVLPGDVTLSGDEAETVLAALELAHEEYGFEPFCRFGELLNLLNQRTQASKKE